MLLVSLLVGQANLRANQLSTMVAVNSFLASDAPRVFDCRLYALVNGAHANTGSLTEQLDARGFNVAIVPRNLGIGEGRNETMRRALADGVRPDFYLELHNDYVHCGSWARTMLDAFEADPQLGLLGALIFTSRGYWSSDALGLDLATEEWQTLVALVEEAKLRAIVRYRDTPTERRIRRGITCPWIGRWSAICEAGGPLYPQEHSWQEYEDTDLVRRLEDAGYKCGVTVDAHCYHHYLYSRLKMRETEDPTRRASYSKGAFFAKYPDAVEWKKRFDEDCERMLLP